MRHIPRFQVEKIMFWWWLVGHVIIGAKCTDRHKNDTIVTVEQGRLKGAIRELLDGTPYYSFKGIPYAQPPVGKLRFKAPQAPKSWNDTYEATEHGPKCLQYNTIQKSVEGNEMCLFLNVYTKSIQSISKIPVMLFIHGGSWMYGSGDADSELGYGPEFLLQHDVILITINYRLEVLGFLCLDTPEVPGNAGIKDQVAALRWVKNNIAKFGGDPDNITIFGESSGGCSVAHHIQSKMSRGLFHKVIAQSGTSLNAGAIDYDGQARAFRVGEVLGCNTSDTEELLTFLQSVPASKLVNLTYSTMTDDEKVRGLPVHFVPVVEKIFHNVEPFITIKPIESLVANELNKVPVVLGYNSVEGLLMVPSQLLRLKFMNQNVQYLVPKEIAQIVSIEKAKELGERIRNFYVGNREFSENDGQALAYMFSDLYFVYDIHRFAHFYSAVAEVYMYEFSFETDLNLIKNSLGLPNLKGASHVDELFYLFYNSLDSNVYKNQEKLRDFVYRVTKLWFGFAKTNNPTPKNNLWTPYTRATRDYLNIDEKFTVGQFADRERVEFWNNIYCEAGLPCITNSSVYQQL